jgi:hypothetical protein
MSSYKIFLVAYLFYFVVYLCNFMLAKTRVSRHKAWSVPSFVPYVFCLQISARDAIFGYPLGIALVEVFVTSLVSLPSLVLIEMYIMLIILIQVKLVRFEYSFHYAVRCVCF